MPGQMKGSICVTAAFATQLEETGYIHGTLRPEAERSLEARMARKNPLRAHSLAGTAAWEQEGEGRVAFAEGVLRLTAPARQEPTAPMEHCAIFGQLTARLRPEPQDWQPYNRLAFRVRPLCLGHSNPQLSVALRNEGAVKIPDPYNREGFHHIGLDNLVWNDCFWEFPDLPRDRVTELSFSVPD
jgi:hypothetical protein